MEGKPISSPNGKSGKKHSRIIRAIFKKNDNFFIQFVKYITIGNIANIIDFSILYLLTEFADFHYLTSAAISFVAGVITGHIICIFWIFHRGRFNPKVEFLAVLLISIVGLSINELIIFFLVKYFSIHYMLSKAISAIVVMFWNFFGRRNWVFNSSLE